MNGTMTREEWLAERRQGIGGSDAAAVLGLSPWRTAVQVWLDKTGRAEPQEETEAMRIGTELEDFVARRYEQETGRTVRRFNKMVHKGCLLGNFDRLVVPDGEKVASHMDEVRTDLLLECKTSSREWEDGVPMQYALQVQHYMGLEPRLLHADVACLFLGRKHFEIFRVERDDEVIKVTQERLTEWWNKYVVGDEMPPPANEADCKLLWARSNPGKAVVADDAVKMALLKYADAKATEKAAKDIAADAMSSICAFMGDGEVLTDAAGKPLLTWKSAKESAKTDWEAVARDLAVPDVVAAVAERHTEVKPGSRRFLPKQAAVDALAKEMAERKSAEPKDEKEQTDAVAAA